MKRKWIITAILLVAFVVHAQEFETIFKCNPLTWAKDGYEIDHSEVLDGTLKKVRYSLKLTDKQDKTTTVVATFVPPTQNLPDLGSMSFILQIPPVQTTPPPWRSKSPTRCGFATGRLRTFANTTSTMLKTNAANSSHGHSG